MTDRDARLANTLAVVALAVTTEMTAEIEAATGRSLREVAALTTLANWSSGQSIEVLRDVLDMSQPGCARLVDRLVDAGLARRAVSADDRRVTTVSITTDGRRVARRARQARARAVARWLADADNAARARLTRSLDDLAAAHVIEAGDHDARARRANRVCRLCDLGACGFPASCVVTDAIDG